MQSRALAVLAATAAIAGCSSGALAPSPTPTPTASPTPIASPTPTASPAAKHLYVANDATPGGIVRYTLPVSASSLPDFTLRVDNAVGVAVDPAGDLAVSDTNGMISYFAAPVGATSTPAAVFKNGTSKGMGQLAFSPTGSIFAATDGPSINVFNPPFSNASVPASSISGNGLTDAIGVAFDATGNLIVSDAASSSLSTYASPYTAPPIAGPAGGGYTAYRRLAVSGGKVYVASDLGGIGGVAPRMQVDVYALPLAAGSPKLFSVINQIQADESVALDATGNLYVGNVNGGSMTIEEYLSPLSSSSSAAVTLGPNATTYSIAIGT